ncbi:MAG: hypothetical protein ACE5H0_14175 [Bacteroidota bacterium]
MHVRLPPNFTYAHRTITRRFVEGKSFPSDERALLFEAFDLLHQAEIDAEGEMESFATIYDRLVESRFANDYLRGLLEAQDVEAVAEPLRAQVSRKIMPALQGTGLLNPAEPLSFYLLAYCLYWWYAFARGYAFEVKVFQDLEASGIAYQAHDVLNPRARRLPFDLVVLGFRGDIKTSTYFLHTVRARELPHDFYIAQVYKPENRERIQVVFLKESAWDALDGDTTPVAPTALAAALPGPLRIQWKGTTLIVLDYSEWKTRVMLVQEVSD